MYEPGQQRAAKKVAHDLGVKPVQPIDRQTEQTAGGADVVVIAGADRAKVSRTGPVLFVALLVASVLTTAAVVLHARTPDLALQVTHFTHRDLASGTAATRVARMRFFVRESDPDATVQIVGPNVKVVRTLYRGPAGRPIGRSPSPGTGATRREPCPIPSTDTGSG